MATLKDIAKIAKVNVSTVSKALNNHTDLNANTILHIKRIADELGYAYTKGEEYIQREKLVGVVLSEVISSYYMGVYSAIQSVLAEAGYRTILMVSDFSAKVMGESVDILCRMPISGLIVLMEEDSEALLAQKVADNFHIPFVAITNEKSVDCCDCISILSYDGVGHIIDYLTDLGHTSIGYIGDELCRVQRGAFRDFMKKRGNFAEDQHMIVSEYRFEKCGYEGMKKLLQQENVPTAVIASYDDVAVGALRAMTEAGLSAPEDISVIGSNDSPFARYQAKSISSLSEPTADLGEAASNVLIDKMKNRKTALQTIMLRTALVLRETTGKPREGGLNVRL